MAETTGTTLKERLNADLHDAMRSNNDVRRSTIRLALADVHNAEIAAGHGFGDAEVEGTLKHQAKQRRDSIDEFEKAGRTDLVQKESAELEVLRSYLPETMSREEIRAIARAVIAETAASGPRDKGKVMGPLLKRIAGRAEGRDVNDEVTALLTGG